MDWLDHHLRAGYRIMRAILIVREAIWLLVDAPHNGVEGNSRVATIELMWDSRSAFRPFIFLLALNTRFDNIRRRLNQIHGVDLLCATLNHITSKLRVRVFIKGLLKHRLHLWDVVAFLLGYLLRENSSWALSFYFVANCFERLLWTFIIILYLSGAAPTAFIGYSWLLAWLFRPCTAFCIHSLLFYGCQIWVQSRH